MRNSLPLVLVTLLMSSVSLAFAASGNAPSVAPAPATSPAVSPAPMTTPKPATPSTDPTMTAAPATPPKTTMTASAGSSLGEYKSISCNSNSAFSINSCDQCFDGGSVKTGEKLTGLFDNWTNSSNMTLSAYKEEQKTPNMVRFGTTTWSTTPASEANVWKYSSDVIWVTPSGETKSQFWLASGQKVKFYEADIGGGYTLDKTDKKSGDLVGMLRFPTVSHSMDLNTANEGPATTHYECVAYKYDLPTVAPMTVVSTGSKTPEPAQVTKTKTGPETLILIAAAFFIAFGMMFTLRRRV